MESPEPWLTLWRVPGVGPSTFARLLEHYGSAASALAAGARDWRERGLIRGKGDVPITSDHPGLDIGPDLRWLEVDGNQLVRLGESAYPPLLAAIDVPPPLLFVKGDPAALRSPQIAMVGSRDPTRSGVAIARDFAMQLARAGICVTSGMALGIDGAGHAGALDAGGLTLAVAGTGLDRVYPARHRGLAERIVDQGALVSEYPIGTRPRAEHFPRRNRLISGLAYGTLVVEAARKSGSLITARYALEQGREVFAVPGSIHNPMAQGCHQLIRDGARLVESANDIVLDLAPQLAACLAEAPSADPGDERRPPTLTPEQRQVLRAIEFDPTPLDSIIQTSGLTTENVSSILLMMEIDGLIAAEAGGCYVRLVPGIVE
ncbi:MAG: DNA-processing protein DprA [Thiotrichales bacterium]